MKVGVLLSGCGVYDGSEIQETAFTLLALARLKVEAVCLAPDAEQLHAVNHLNGEEMPQNRNMLVEAARIARGAIKSVADASSSELDALAIPGGFGAAKNLTGWASSGPDGDILPEVKKLIKDMVEAGKPIAAMCMAPVVVAKALEGSGRKAKLTVGTTAAPSPYDIGAISAGLSKTGAEPVMCGVDGIVTDEANKIVTSPCYMMEATVDQVHDGVEKACKKLIELARAGRK